MTKASVVTVGTEVVAKVNSEIVWTVSAIEDGLYTLTAEVKGEQKTRKIQESSLRKNYNVAEVAAPEQQPVEGPVTESTEVVNEPAPAAQAPKTHQSKPAAKASQTENILDAIQALKEALAVIPEDISNDDKIKLNNGLHALENQFKSFRIKVRGKVSVSVGRFYNGIALDALKTGYASGITEPAKLMEYAEPIIRKTVIELGKDEEFVERVVAYARFQSDRNLIKEA